MAIRKVNVITGPGCAEAQEASYGGPAASKRDTGRLAATESEHDGIRQRNTFGTECRIFARRRTCLRLHMRAQIIVQRRGHGHRHGLSRRPERRILARWQGSERTTERHRVLGLSAARIAE